MKPNPIPLIAAILFLPLLTLAQAPVSTKIFLRSGTIEPVPNIAQNKLDAQHDRAAKTGQRRLALLQFAKMPSESEKQLLKENGIELLDYVPDNTYSVSITERPDADLLDRLHARALVELTATQKIHSSLLGQRTVSADVWISFPRSFSFNEVKTILQQKNFTIKNDSRRDQRILTLSIPMSRLEELASLSCVEYVERAPAAPEILKTGFTQWGIDAIKTSALNLPVSEGGKGLTGLGVVIGMGDDSEPSPHPDFNGRLIPRSWEKWNFHGSHVAGIIGGAGLINELRKGAAPASTLIVQTMDEILTWIPTYVNDNNMVLTNNSYGTRIFDCADYGAYTLVSRSMDQLSFTFPHLQQVFASGNSGQASCAPVPAGYRTVLNDYQVAKNVLTVGNTTATGDIFIASSRGPSRDGRIKPEICAIGTGVTSTTFAFVWNYYADNTGTSMACPAITGGMGLLYEKYRSMHSNADPDNVLMKALVVNSGDDYGNPGPDYIYGYGQANFWRATEMLENNHYVVNTINSGDPDQTVPITIPAGTAALKVMICWNDPAAAPFASQTLVNDLDLRVEPPSGPTEYPFILDTTVAGFANNATQGIDHINNLEQVVIKNPTAGGTYNVKIKANNITQGGSQKYAVVYDLVPNEIRLLCPMQSNAFVQGDSVIVQWDCYDEPANTFKLEFAANGTDFVDVNANIPANKRQYYLTNPNQFWVVPQGVSSNQARMRISKNGTSLSYTSGPFVIHDTIQVSLSADQCPGYFSIDWNAVVGATGYEVMMIRGAEMKTIATVNGSTLSYTISDLVRDSVYWVTVRPLINGSPGRRAFAVSRTPDNGTCTSTMFDKDLLLDSLVSPNTEGRINTSISLSSNTSLQVRIKNLDNAAVSGSVDIGYILNNGAPVIESINPTIIANGTYIHTFTAPVDLSAAGNYQFKFFVKQAGDPNPTNDTLTILVRQLVNVPITGIDYPAAFKEDFETSPDQFFLKNKKGLPGVDRFDFATNSTIGRIRTYLNTGLAYSGTKAMTMDVKQSFIAVTADSLTGTFDLSNYHAATDDIRLDFQYRNHYQLNYPGNKVWIRAADTASWVPVYDLYANQLPPGSFKFSGSIELSDSLLARSKDFSTSTQIRWGQEGSFQATNFSGAGYTFDDIRIYRVVDDVQMVSIDSPWNVSCGLSSTTPVRITVRNTSNQSLSGSIPVQYRINGGGWVNELAPAPAPNSSASYTFTTPANLSASGQYILEAVVAYTSDSYRLNDTARLTVYNQPLFTVTNTNPYLEDFETGNGDWFTTGSSSWEYGTPASMKINRAASGNKAWKTGLQSYYPDGELSYLYSPCFNISSLSNPSLSFSIALDLEDCGNGGFCDGAYMEYSVDGLSWSRLGSSGQGTNWYNRAYSGNNVWSIQNYQRWHVATIPLSVIPVSQNLLTSLRFRFVFSSDAAVNRDGVAFDDFHIYSNSNPIYVTAGDSPVVNQATVSGTSWINFIESSGKIIAALNPANQSMGSTDVQSYINSGSPRVSSNQFYLNRNITVKPTTRSLIDSATVRFYFSDAEAEALIGATGCSCSKPASAYELGVTKFTSPTYSIENGTLADNNNGAYSFITNAKIKLVPYDVGYYAQFKVKDFSEFWLSNGGLTRSQPLPLTLLDFTARKQANPSQVLLKWRTAEEINFSHFELEVARGNDSYQQNRFNFLTRIYGSGGQGIEKEYSYIDTETPRSGVYFYRLKMVDIDGSFRYSPIRPIIYSDDLIWQLYPNPAENITWLTLQVTEGALLQIRLIDQNGRVIKQFSRTGTGFVQKIAIELQGLPSGLYTIEAGQGSQKQYFRLLRQ